VDDNEVAAFSKSPETGSSESSQQTPQDAAIESARDEILEGVDPDIETINERTSEDRDYQREMEILDQTPDDDLTIPDIDG